LVQGWRLVTDLSWRKLRAVGNLRFLKVSYILLVFVPVLATENAVTSFLGFQPWLLAVSFFASLSLAVANAIYDITCPAIVKRFESTADLYERMLQIKQLSQALYPADFYMASVAHCEEAYQKASVKNRTVRALCGTAYWIAVVLFAVLFADRAIVVTANLCR
jgi:hypothetical protein